MKYFLFFLVVLGFTACKDAALSDTPVIEFVSITPSEVQEWQDSIVITISYKDGDGDLGENNANVNNLFVKDLRLNQTVAFRINQLSPETDITIQGNLNVVLPNTALTNPNGASETVQFEIFVNDRAGNKSNTITTTPILVVF
jgi:hypothetical protein